MEITTRSPGETAAIGRWIGQRLAPGSFLALVGDLGAGKTVLAQGLLAGLGIERGGGSPTFPLLWEYAGGRLHVYHWDVYRVEDSQELVDLGYEDSFCGDGVCIVEWADRVRELWPDRYLCIEIAADPAGAPVAATPEANLAPGTNAAPDRRRLRLTAAGDALESMVVELSRAGFGA